MSIWMLVLFATAMISAVLGQAADLEVSWGAWVVCVVSLGLFAAGLVTGGVRKPVV